ncbi:MAG: TRAM domain-containing protein [Coriobacteriales bacterium]|nr:TRAM domain-containing protein [Coriobacteriales bacterium]
MKNREKIKYNQVFTFLYSKREGTPAAKIQDNTPKEEIQARFDMLVDLVQKNAYELNCKDLDKEVDVLVEGISKRDPNIYEAKSPKNQTVHFEKLDSNVNLIGKIVRVKISDVKTWYLFGKLV